MPTLAAAQRDRESFVIFIKEATKNRKSSEFKELSTFLEQCFTDADVDFDGCVRKDEFDHMVEAAANLPRRFGFAPTAAETYSSTAERTAARQALFAKIDTDGSGFISYDKWLAYIYPHICEKAKTLDVSQAASKMERSKADFCAWVVSACRSCSSMEYKELYSFLLQCFTEADTDCDGRIGAEAFDALIERAASAPRKFGFAPPASTTYKSAEERIAARKAMFEKMDEDKGGFISFEEWLNYSFRHICEKAQTLDNTLSGHPPNLDMDQHPASQPAPAVKKADATPLSSPEPGRRGSTSSSRRGSNSSADQARERRSAKTSSSTSPADQARAPVSAKTSREGFVTFIKEATRSTGTPEYSQLYGLLLNCFTEADIDFDGKIALPEFDAMVEAAASLPRRFGFAPTVAEMFNTPDDRIKARRALFDRIDSDSTGFISFDRWLAFIYPHICEKAATLDLEKAKSKMERSRDDFRAWVVAACRSRNSVEYKELYNFLLRCFTEADTDCDGRIAADAFDALIDVAARAPRRFGFAPSVEETYKSPAARRAARKAMFEKMDTDKGGFISFEEWLTYAYSHISEKVAVLEETDHPMSMTAAEEDREAFVLLIKRAAKDRSSHEYNELYRFLLKCFTTADSDFDGRIGKREFDAMVEAAANLPRRFGFAPTAPEIYGTRQERLEARAALFARIDTDGVGFISFDKWLDYIYPHICEKAASLDQRQAVSQMERSKEDFRNFIVAACRSRASKEYKELYGFLQRCFTEADTDGVGNIGAGAFDALIDVAAQAPRRFGFAPPAIATYKDAAERARARKAMLEKMDEDGEGFISFEAWLTYSYEHICKKAATLDPSLDGSVPEVAAGVCQDGSGRPVASAVVPRPCSTSGPCPVSATSRLAAAERSREGFVRFLQGATRSRSTEEYGELYHFLLRCFNAADSDFDGKIGLGEFDCMVEVAASLPRRFGFAPTVAELFNTPAERKKARAALFSRIATDCTGLSSGFISFDKWMDYIYPHICEKAATLDLENAKSRMERSRTDFRDWVVAACRSRASMEYKELYSFLLECFTTADTDCDGRIGAEAFDALIDVAAKAPRRFGFAPSAEETYRTPAERTAARRAMFQKMDEDRGGFISFEEWLAYCYTHICEKAKTLDATLSGKPPQGAKAQEEAPRRPSFSFACCAGGQSGEFEMA